MSHCQYENMVMEIYDLWRKRPNLRWNYLKITLFWTFYVPFTMAVINAWKFLCQWNVKT